MICKVDTDTLIEGWSKLKDVCDATKRWIEGMNGTKRQVRDAIKAYEEWETKVMARGEPDEQG